MLKKMKEFEINSNWLVKLEPENDSTLILSLWNRKFNVEIGRQSIAFGENPADLSVILSRIEIFFKFPIQSKTALLDNSCYYL